MPELWDDAPGDLSDWSIDIGQQQQEAPAENAEPEPASAERPRNERGQFVKAEEPEPEPDPAPEVSEEKRQKVLDKFNAEDDIATAYAHLERKLGEQAVEIGQLRAELQYQQQPQMPQPQLDLDEMIERDPAQAAEMAWRSGNMQTLEYALDQWNEISPGARALWVENKQLQVRLDQVASETQPLRQQSEEQARLSVVAQAYSALSAKYPDLDSMRPKMAEVAGELKELAGASVVDTLLNSGQPKAVARALEMLYKEARDRTTDNLSDVSRQLAQQHAQNTARAREEALVASTTASSGEAPKLSVADQIAASWAKADAPFVAGEDGWNI